MSSNPKNPRPTITEPLPFNHPYAKKPRIQIHFPEQGRTKQSFKDEADINNIMARYISTGQMPVINQTAPQYLDVDGMEFQSAMQFVAGAQSLFQELPSSVRNRFNNDPAAFLDFTHDPKNREEMAQMGLLRPDAPVVIPTVILKNPEAPTASKEAESKKPAEAA